MTTIIPEISECDYLLITTLFNKRKPEHLLINMVELFDV
jgi:hypothetical protein